MKLARPADRKWMLLVFAAGVLAFLPALRNGFVSDDHALVESRLADSGWSGPDSILGSSLFGRDHQGRPISYFYRPWVSATHALDAALFDGHASGHHAHNLLLHGVVCVLLFLLVQRLGAPRGVALATSLLFALHPIHAESVVIVTGRPDLWAAAFLLGALLAVMRGWDRVALALLLGALASKEVAAVFPAVLPLAALGTAPTERRRAGLLLGWGLALVAAMAVVRFAWIGITAHDQAWYGEGGLAARAATFLAATGQYTAFLLWPVQRGILHHYPLVDSFTDVRLWLGVGVLWVMVTSLVWGWRRGHRRLALGAGWYLFFLLPTSHVVPLPFGPADLPFPLFERYLYLPSLGFVLWLVEGVRLLVGPRRTLVPASLAMAGLVWLSWLRTPDFQDDVTLMEVSARGYAHPATPLANAAYFRWMDGQPEEALETFLRALDLEPGAFEATLGLATVEADLAQTLADEAPRRAVLLAQADARVRRLLDDHPQSARAWEVLGTVRALQGDEAAAMEVWRRALSLEDWTESLVRNMESLAATLVQRLPPEDPAQAVSHWVATLQILTGGPGSEVPAALAPHVEHARAALARAVEAAQD